MNLQDLKTDLENNIYSGTPIIFVTGGNTFIPYQYTKKISDIIQRPVKLIDSLDSVVINKVDIFNTNTNDEYLCVFNTEDFNYTDISLLNQTNVIVVTKLIKDAATREVFQDIIVECPKIESWQMKAYLYTNGKGIETRKLDWLLSLCKDDIFRLDQEVSKLSIFSESERKYIFDDFVEDGIFDDLASSSVFNLINAIVTKDRSKLLEIYQDINNIDISEFGLLTLLYNNFKNIIQIQLGNNPTAEKLGVSPKQFSAIKYNCGRYTASQLADVFEFLTEIDFKIKTGQLPTDLLVDYLVQKILSI